MDPMIHTLAPPTSPTAAAAMTEIERALAVDTASDRPQAEYHYRRAIQLDPSLVGAYVNLAGCYLRGQQLHKAQRAIAQALAIDPTCAIAYHQQAVIEQALGLPDQSIASLQAALQLDPNLAEAYMLLGHCWINKRGFDSWLDVVHKQPPPATAAHLDPYSQALLAYWQGMNCSRRDRRDWAAAERYFRQSIALCPTATNAAASLSQVLAYQNRFAEALQVVESGLAAMPENRDLQLNRALCLLVLGRWREGFAAYECRSQSDQGVVPVMSGKQWDGSPLDGTLLVVVEQGLGDTLQFARYLPWVKQRCRHVVLACERPSLVRLLASLPGVDRVLQSGGSVHYAAYIHLMSLPWVFGTTVDNVPAPIPYVRSLVPAPPLPQRQPDRTAVGIVWSSGYHTTSLFAEIHRQKSMTLETCAAALNLPQVQLYSLQVDRSEADAARLAELGIIDLAPQIHDFADTAAWLDQLDLLITVDTAICHLAGAMGKPVWTLLYFAADWRWLLDREDTPWYPTMRLFRQTTAGDWSGPLARVRSALGELARSRQALPQTLPQRSR
jgi:tetratricopeptide (TPR) repeat protein